MFQSIILIVVTFVMNVLLEIFKSWLLSRKYRTKKRNKRR